MKTVLLLSLLVCSAWAATPFQLCEKEPTDVKVTGVVVPDCNAPPCVFKKGTNVTISITFTTSKAFSDLTNAVYGEIGGIDVPFPGFPSDMKDICKLGPTCPTKAGGSYTEKVILPVASSDPSISLTAKVKFKSGSDTMGCMEVPLKISS